jgi:hypothetical protein
MIASPAPIPGAKSARELHEAHVRCLGDERIFLPHTYKGVPCVRALLRALRCTSAITPGGLLPEAPVQTLPLGATTLDAILHKQTILVSFELAVLASTANRQKFWIGDRVDDIR